MDYYGMGKLIIHVTGPRLCVIERGPCIWVERVGDQFCFH